MEIERIRTSGFRKFESAFETHLYHKSYITGKNTSGKTNILYAIIWAFLGSNLTGDERVWLGNNKSENCFVELEFLDNNQENHILVRSKNKYDNKKNFILLDNKEIKQEELTRFYGDKKLFLSILNPSYFISKKPAEQKELIDKYLPQVNISSVYNKLDNCEKVLLEDIPTNITEYISDLREEKKLNEDKIKNLKGKIEYAENIANEIIQEKKIFEREEELSLAKQELIFLNSDKTIADKEEQMQVVKALEKELKEMEIEINHLSTKMADGKKKYLIIKNSVKSCCPICEQEIKDIAKENTIKKMKEELEEFFYKRSDLEKSLTDLKININTEKCKFYAIQDSIQDEDRMKEIELQINILEKEKREIEKFNSSIDFRIVNAEVAKKDIKKYKENINQHLINIQNIEKTIKIAQKLYINYIEEKMKDATKYLNSVAIKYYSVLKESGELKEDFVITYKGNDYKNLSKSESIDASIELSNMFNKISGVNLPIFIDDSESCADYNFIEQYSKSNQLLITQVKKGEELHVKNYESLEDEKYLQVA